MTKDWCSLQNICSCIYAPIPWSEENFWNKLWEMNAARGTFVPYFFICFLVSCGHWNVKFCSLASILPRPYTALTNSYVEPRETANARFFGLSCGCWDDTFPVGPSSQPTIWRPPLVLSSVSGIVTCRCIQKLMLFGLFFCFVYFILEEGWGGLIIC